MSSEISLTIRDYIASTRAPTLKTRHIHQREHQNRLFFGFRCGSWANLPATPGAFQATPRHASDAFVAKLNATGSALVYATFLGGSILGGIERERSAITVDAGGNAYVAGWTNSSDFLTTPGALRTCDSSGGMFVTKVNALGTALGYSACIGATLPFEAPSIALDAAGNAYVAGHTTSPNFPTTPGSFQPIFAAGTCLGYPCYHGFVFKLNPTGSAFVYSTSLQGSRDRDDLVRGLAVDSAGNAYVTGGTNSSDFPKTPGALQMCGSSGGNFITKINPQGTGLIYSACLAGVGFGATGMAIDPPGNAYVVGVTLSTDLPQINPIQAGFAGGERRQCLTLQYCQDAFILKLNATGTALLYSTYFGGGGDDWGLGIAPDQAGNAYVTGTWGSSPSLNGGNKVGSFLIKLAGTGASPRLTPEGVTEAAGFQPGIAPGQIATVFGVNITNVKGILTASSFPLPTELGGGSSVAVDGVLAPIFAVANVNGQQQINFQVPPNASLYAPFGVAVINNGAHRVPVSANQSSARPGIFTTDGTRGAIQHGLDSQPVTPSSPAARGGVVVIYATGLGPVRPDPGPGNPVSSSPLSVLVYPTSVSVTVGGVSAQVLFSGLAPGFVGLNQVNIQIPPNAPSGDDDVVITVMEANYPISSKPVKLAVQ